MPSVDPANLKVKDDSHERGISREEYKSGPGSGDESEMDVTESEDMETKIIELSDDEDVEIVAETIDLTGGRHHSKGAETVDEVIDLTNDRKENQGESRFGTDDTCPVSGEKDIDMEEVEVQNSLNEPFLNLEDHLDENELALGKPKKVWPKNYKLFFRF